MAFDRQLRPATETSWVVSYGGKTIPRWRTAAILKIDISPYLSEKSSDFHEILYTAADFELIFKAFSPTSFNRHSRKFLDDVTLAGCPLK